jgi:predicted  nucleic acid-binding Zn-ribbon protein
MQEIKKLAAKIKVTKQNKGNKILLTLIEAEGIQQEVLLLQDEIKELKEKISNAIPEVVYITVENENAAPAEVFINTEEQEPIKEKIVNITGKPFRE